MTYEHLKEHLLEGLQSINLNLDNTAVNQLIKYVALLNYWNKFHTITSVKDGKRMIDYHIVDSLSGQQHVRQFITKLIANHRLVDIGSGGGQPGIPLAIVNTELPITLVDSNHKKCAFLKQTVIELGLRNVNVICERVEKLPHEKNFTIVTSRAFAKLVSFITLTKHLLHPHGIWLAYKGSQADTELAELPQYIQVLSNKAIFIYGIDGCRHLISLRLSELESTL